jgi:hypothetical protein
MLSWLHKWQYRNRLAQEDAAVLIARYGVRASYNANRHVAMMRNGLVFHSDRPRYHWKRVYSITRELLPYDDDEAMVSEGANNSVNRFMGCRPFFSWPAMKMSMMKIKPN